MAERLDGTTALVTGASSGIGAATARELHAAGAVVVLAARREDRLEALAAELGGRTVVLQADLTDPEQARDVVARAVDATGRLDALVANAGVMLLGPLESADPADLDRMLALNTAGLVHTVQAALPHLLASAADGPRRTADVVLVSSLGGRRASSGAAVYALTKFGLSGFAEALRQEVTTRHVRVSLVEPGATATELREQLPPGLRAQQAERYREVEVLTAEDVADAVGWIVTRPRRVAVNEVLLRPAEQQG